MFPWYIYAIGAAVFGTAFTLFRKQALKSNHAMEFESARMISKSLLLLAFLPFIDAVYSWKVIGIIYIVSVLATAAIVFVSKSLRHAQISYIAPLGHLKAMFILILAFIFLGETPSFHNLIGIIIILFSAYILEADHHFSNLLQPIKNIFRYKYNLYFLIAVFFFSITAIFDKHIMTNYLDPLEFLILVNIFIAININIVHGFLFGFKEVGRYFKKKPVLPFLVAFFSVGSNIMYLNALKLAYVSLVAPVGMLSTLFVVFVGGKFFKEDNVAYRLFVSAIMLVGVYLIIR